MARRNVVIMGAAGRDFHNFNCLFRDDEVAVEEYPGCFIAKVDIGAHGVAAKHRDEDGAVSFLAGEPVLVAGQRRDEDLRDLHESLRRGERDTLAATRGAFCLAHSQPGTHRLVLATDRGGLRTIYFYRRQ